MKDSDEIFKQTLMRDLEQAMMVNQLDGVRTVLDGVSRFEGVNEVHLLNYMGEPVYSFGATDTPTLTKKQWESVFLQGNDLERFTLKGDRSFRTLFLPVPNKDSCRVCHRLTSVNGALVIKQRSIDIGSETNFMVGIMLVSLIVASMTAALTLLIMLSRRVIGPIRNIIDATKKVSRNQFDTRVRIEREELEGEVAELAQAFNEMTGYLKKSRDEVESRTVRLEEANRSMRLAQKKLVQSEKLAAIGTLVAGIAHEINNPVGIIAARADCMMMEAKDKGIGEQCTDDLMVINKHAGRIADITRALLTFARQAPVEMVPLDINGVVSDTLFLVGKQFEKEGLTIKLDLADEGGMVLGNDNRLQHVLLNLLNNARDAMPDGGLITISTSAEDNVVQMSVGDSGEGMPDETLDQIFDPFFTTKDIGKGTGLGLAVSYGMIQDMGGVIEADSMPGEGTVFTITMPRMKGDAVERQD
jgi:two-component system NtrC family sensor kinase